ncbi:unnamed protein product [Ectocarpus sp. 13 AM-2016]
MTDHAASSARQGKVHTTQPGRSGYKVRRHRASNKRDGCNGNNPQQNGPGSASGRGGSKTKKTGKLGYAAPISSVPPPSSGALSSSSLKQRPSFSVIISGDESGGSAGTDPPAAGRDMVTAGHRSSHHVKSDVKTLVTGSTATSSCADRITHAAVHNTTTPDSRASLDPCDGLKRGDMRLLSRPTALSTANRRMPAEIPSYGRRRQRRMDPSNISSSSFRNSRKINSDSRKNMAQRIKHQRIIISRSSTCRNSRRSPSMKHKQLVLRRRASRLIPPIISEAKKRELNPPAPRRDSSFTSFHQQRQRTTRNGPRFLRKTRAAEKTATPGSTPSIPCAPRY